MRRADILRKFDEHGITATPQRVEVARVLLVKPQHLSVTEINRRLQARGCSISNATVYNTLNIFVERGLVRELNVDPQCRLFDSATHKHHHFYNVDSGELTDVNDVSLALSRMPELPQGTEPDGVEILIRVKNRQD